MLQKDISKIDSSEKALKEFGVTMAMLCGLIAAMHAWRTGHTAIGWFAGAVLFLLSGLFQPTKLKILQKIWMSLALLMGWIMTRVILSVIFYLVLTPLAWIAKIFGVDFLRPRAQKSAQSYWVPSKITRSDLDNYKQQF